LGWQIQDHYAKSGAGHSIAERILTTVYAAGGPATPVTPETLAPFDHYHGGGLAATEGLATLLEPQAGESIVDIGSGIGGPARWLANRFNCKATGVDLTPEFCDAARQRGAPENQGPFRTHGLRFIPKTWVTLLARWDLQGVRACKSGRRNTRDHDP
jgi:SAM-dependent methyltransferase